MIFILNEFKFDIDINNDKLMKTIWNIRKKNLIIDGSAFQHKAQV